MFIYCVLKGACLFFLTPSTVSAAHILGDTQFDDLLKKKKKSSCVTKQAFPI